MKLVTANIKSVPLMLQSSVVSDVGRVRTLGDVICWQEIAPQRYKDAVQEYLGAGWRHVHLDRETPISFQTDKWKLLKQGWIRTHSGRPHVTPSRYVVWVILESLGDGRSVAVVNTHYISGAWNNKHLATRTWRRAQWLAHFKKEQDVVVSLNRLGHSVIAAGDTNRVVMPRYTMTQRELVHGSIDHITVCEAKNGTRIELVGVSSRGGFHTDHKPHVAEMLLAS